MLSYVLVACHPVRNRCCCIFFRRFSHVVLRVLVACHPAFLTPLAASVPENQHDESHVATIFCNHLEKLMLPKRRFSKPKNILDQSTESPILFRSCGHETSFSDQKGASKIGEFRALCWTVFLSTFQGFRVSKTGWHATKTRYSHSSDQKIARFRTHYLRNKFSICEY